MTGPRRGDYPAGVRWIADNYEHNEDYSDACLLLAEVFEMDEYEVEADVRYVRGAKARRALGGAR